VGIVLDSTVFIAAERKGMSARQALAEIALRLPGERAAISVITLTELAHGAARADTLARHTLRREFIDELLTAVPVHSVTDAVALRAGQIDGQSTAKGVRLALADLLIGVTALDLGYSVATANVRHFNLIPGLGVALL
jgi:predicted nucleic acid-binding protein